LHKLSITLHMGRSNTLSGAQRAALLAFAKKVSSDPTVRFVSRALTNKSALALGLYMSKQLRHYFPGAKSIAGTTFHGSARYVTVTATY
jgi:hypothetical protein